MSNISTTTVDPAVSSLLTARAAIQQIGQPLLFVVGMIGCLLNIAIFIRPSMRQNSCAIYFHANSWANLFCLTWGVLASMLAFFTNNNPAAYNVVYCKLRFYMINFSQWSSRAFLVLACLDRFLLCSSSARQRLFCRAVVAKKVIVITAFICACLPIYILITYQPGQRIIPCAVTTDFGAMYETVCFWMLTFIVPTLSMSIFSGLTMRRLKQNAKRVGRDKIRLVGKDIQLAGMLIAQVLLYMMTNVPYVSLVLYGKITESTPTSSKSPQRIAAESFANTLLASFFYYVFNGVSFFVYTLTAPSFRRELLLVILPRQWLQKIQLNNQPHTMPLTNRINPLKQTIPLRKITRTVVEIDH